MSRFFCNDLPMLAHHHAFSDVSLINYKPKYSFCQIFLTIELYCSGIAYINSKKVRDYFLPTSSSITALKFSSEFSIILQNAL